jgi:hypothetical protein
MAGVPPGRLGLPSFGPEDVLPVFEATYFPLAAPAAGSPAFVLVDTTLIRIIGKPDLIHLAGC